MTKRRKRVYTPEFRAEAVRLAKVGDRSLSQVARDLSLHDSVLRDWIAKDAAAAVPAPPDALSEAERRELVELRREVRQLREDREILKKRRPSSRRRPGEVRLHRRAEGSASGRRPVP